MKKLILTISVAAFLAGVYFLTAPENPSKKAHEKIEIIDLGSKANFVTKDFQDLNKQKKLPYQFGNLSKIEFLYHDQDLQKLIPVDSLPFRTTKDGRFMLEVETFSAPAGEKKIIVLQINVLDSQTKNKVYELSRNYEMKN